MSELEYDVSLGAVQVLKTVRLEVPYSTPRPDERAFLAYFRDDSGRWEPVPAQDDPARRVLTYDTSHLSRWTVFF